MFNPSTWSLWLNFVVFLLAAACIAGAGSKLAGLADRIADRTGLGEALTGTIFLGFVTALPGLTASITAAVDGYPALAISNAIGGIAIQTTFLTAGDIVHFRANLEHAAASVANMLQTAILATLLTMVVLGLTGPEVTVFNHIHPLTPVLFLTAGFGLLLVQRTDKEPMWKPKDTSETVRDVPEEGAHKENLKMLLLGFFTSAVIVTICGVVVARTTSAIADQSGLSQTVVGGLLTGVATSLPELVTTVSAVWRGALTLAVSDIIGGNFFDVLFVFAADLVYLQGSLYHAPGVGPREVFLTGLTVLLNLILLLGLIYRQRRGPANIGFESLLIVLLYLSGFFIISFYM